MQPLHQLNDLLVNCNSSVSIGGHESRDAAVTTVQNSVLNYINRAILILWQYYILVMRLPTCVF